MQAFKYTVHVERSPAQVWAFMMDFTKAPSWRRGVREMRVLTDGPLRVGTELLVTFELADGPRTARCEVWAFETARRFGLRSTTRKATGSYEYVLVPDSGGTTITFTCDLRPRGVMWLLVAVMIRTNRERFAHHLPNLKREVERVA